MLFQFYRTEESSKIDLVCKLFWISEHGEKSFSFEFLLFVFFICNLQFALTID